MKAVTDMTHVVAPYDVHLGYERLKLPQAQAWVCGHQITWALLSAPMTRYAVERLECPPGLGCPEPLYCSPGDAVLVLQGRLWEAPAETRAPPDLLVPTPDFPARGHLVPMEVVCILVTIRYGDVAWVPAILGRETPHWELSERLGLPTPA